MAFRLAALFVSFAAGLAALTPAAPASANELAASAQRGIACTREYRPVCARTRAGRLRTFPNACEARQARARIIRRRPCR